MLDTDKKRKQEVRRARETVKWAFGAWEKCSAPEALNFKMCLQTFSFIKGNNHYHLF